MQKAVKANASQYSGSIKYKAVRKKSDMCPANPSTQFMSFKKRKRLKN